MGGERHKDNPEMLNQNPTVIVTEAAGQNNGDSVSCHR